MLSVAIAVEPPTDAVVQVVAQSCEDAIGEGRCPDAAQLSPAEVVPWYALVRVEDPSALALKLEFHDRSASGTLIETRTLSFAERDPLASRWATVGAVIAAFVAARDSARAPPPASRPRPLPPSGAAPKPSGTPGWDLDLAWLLGPGLDRGPYRFGGLGRGYLALPAARGVLGLLSLRYAEKPGDLELSWWSASCGFGGRLGRKTSSITFELTGEFAFEHLSMSAVDPSTNTRDSARQSRFGGRLSLNLALKVTHGLAWVVGAEVSALRPSVVISVGPDASGRLPAVSYAFSTGLRLSGGDD
jgi:hypothetical protein